MKKLPKQNVDDLLFILRRPSIRCGTFINFIVVSVLIVAVHENIMNVATHTIIVGKIQHQIKF